MAGLAAKGELGFKQITILKSEALGMGSYGAVYKAKCDHLICAAKLLHPTLFNITDLKTQQQADPTTAHRLPARRFEQECAFLSSIHHPNIVQYLGTHRDQATGLPVLLMELMDHSLTHFLEKSPQMPLPFHTQVNICHDIALALSFLHSNGIIHRDLSSNNVLMIADRRAKVTDFGMATMFEVYAQTKTAVPGTAVYMPPQAHQDKPQYTFKLDCFTLGVLFIQIMTQQFPKPDVKLAKVERDGEEFFKKVAERERRKNHISLIASDHPLLPLVLECIEDEEMNRPSADSIAERLGNLKTLPLYSKSESACNVVLNDAHHTIQYISSLESLLRQKEEQIQSLNTQIWEKMDREKQIEEDGATTALSKDVTMTFQEGKRAPRALYRMSNAVLDGEIIYFLSIEIHVLFYAYNSTTSEWFQLPDVDIDGKEWHTSTITATFGCLTTVGGYDEDENLTNRLFTLVTRENVTGWEAFLPPMPTERDGSIAINYGHYLLVAGGMAEDDCYLRHVEVLDTDTMQWFVTTPLPEPLSNASWTLCNDTVYLLGGWFSPNTPTCSVLTCKLEELIRSRNLKPDDREATTYRHRQVWSRIADLPVLKSTCVTFRDRLLAVGGVDVMNKPVSAIYMYDWTFNSWRVVAHMLVPRGQAFATVLPSSDQMLIVGGHNGYYLNKIYEVELVHANGR